MGKNDEKNNADMMKTAEMPEKEVMKKKKKKKTNKGVNDSGEGESTVAFGVSGEMEMKKNMSDTFEIQVECGKEVVEEKKKQKVKRNNNFKEGKKDGEVSREISKKVEKKSKDDNNQVKPDVEDHTLASEQDGGTTETKKNHERKTKKLKLKRKDNFKDDLSAAQQEYVDYDPNSLLNTNETPKSEAEHTKKRKTSLVVNSSDETFPNKSIKKVRFSSSNTDKGNVEEEILVRGKRFTLEEDKIVKDAVIKYIEDHELGDEGLDMVLNSKKHPEVKGCWKEITSCIPYRPYVAVGRRARLLFVKVFQSGHKRKWTQEEKDMVLKHQKLHGNQWKALEDELGKYRTHVRNLWSTIKCPNLKKGRWSQDEYQKLFDLVNADLQLKVSEEKRSHCGMLRDNISWTAISDVLLTRHPTRCCDKWYRQLTSAMVVEGVWADSDDYRLVGALYSLDATCMEDVDWDSVIETRSGDVCRRRWNQMVRHIGRDGKKSFADQVEVLAKRYCPHLLEARQTWDDKPRVP